MDEFTSQHVYAEFPVSMVDQRWGIQRIYLQSHWFTALEDVAEAAAVISMEGPEKHSGMDYWFSVESLTPHQVAETLTAVTGRKFTAAVHHAEGFQNDAAQPGSAFEPAYAKGGLELFRQVEDGRMAYVGSVKDDTKKILGREPLLLSEWAKLHASELLEIAGG